MQKCGKYTLNEGNERGDWLKSWLMVNDYSALNTMFRKTSHEQTFLRFSKKRETNRSLFWQRKDIWEMWRTLRPTKSSTWVATREMYHDYFPGQHAREEHPYSCQEGKQTTWYDWTCWTQEERKTHQHWYVPVRRKMLRNRWHIKRSRSQKKGLKCMTQ